jgi:hypothetical protein
MAAVINRKRNRTISQDRAASDPKWDNIGGGVLQRHGANRSTQNRIHLYGTQWKSVSYQDAQRVQQRQEEEQQVKQYLANMVTPVPVPETTSSTTATVVDKL